MPSLNSTVSGSNICCPETQVTPKPTEEVNELETALVAQMAEAMREQRSNNLVNMVNLFAYDPPSFTRIFKALCIETAMQGMHGYHLGWVYSKTQGEGMFTVCYPGSNLPKVVVRLRKTI